MMNNTDMSDFVDQMAYSSGSYCYLDCAPTHAMNTLEIMCKN